MGMRLLPANPIPGKVSSNQSGVNGKHVDQYEPPQIVKPTEVIMEWDSPERQFQRKPREFYRKIAVIIIFFALLLLLIKEFLLIAVLGVVFFVVYVFTTIPPRIVHHQITNNGINFAGEKLYRWEELRSFFIEKKNKVNVLNVDTVAMFPGRLFIIMPDEIKVDEVTKVVNEYISIAEIPEITMFEKINRAVAKRFSL